MKQQTRVRNQLAEQTISGCDDPALQTAWKCHPDVRNVLKLVRMELCPLCPLKTNMANEYRPNPPQKESGLPTPNHHFFQKLF